MSKQEIDAFVMVRIEPGIVVLEIERCTIRLALAPRIRDRTKDCYGWRIGCRRPGVTKTPRIRARTEDG